MLVGVADDSRPVACDGGRRGGADIEPVDESEPGRRTLEACDDTDERRLARAARTEHDADLAPLDPERQPAERGNAAVLGRMNDEHVAQVDERAHPSPPIRPGPRGSANARRVVHATSATVATANAAVPTASVSGSTVVARGGSGASALAVTDTTRVTRYASAMPASAPTPAPTTPTSAARAATTRRRTPGCRALRLEVGELAAVVAEVGADREHEPGRREHERRERGRREREERPVAERIAPCVRLERRA